MKNRIQGFTLIELIIVVAIIAVLAAVAVPYALRSRLAANETATIAAMRTLVSAQESFKTSGGGHRFAALVELASATPPYVDATLGAGTVSGYTIELVNLGDETWEAIATPVNSGSTGNRTFLVDQSGLISYTIDGNQLGEINAATGTDTLVAVIPAAADSGTPAEITDPPATDPAAAVVANPAPVAPSSSAGVPANQPTGRQKARLAKLQKWLKSRGKGRRR